MSEISQYEVRTVDWRIGLFIGALGTVLVARHEQSVAGWQIVVAAGLITIILARVASLPSGNVRLFLGLLFLAIGSGRSLSETRLAGVSSLGMAVVLAYINLMLLPALNPHVRVVSGKRVRRPRRTAKADCDWRAVCEPIRPRIGHDFLFVVVRMIHRLLTGTAITVGAATAILSFLWPPRELRIVLLLVQFNLLSVAVAAAALGLRSSFDRFIPRSVWLRFASDEQPPVLYLRPFVEDGRTSGVENHPLGIFVGAAGYFAMTTPIEAAVAQALTHLGPVIALTEPGERRSLPGAIRVSVGERWQDAARSLISCSAGVVVQLGRGRGIEWEVASVMESGELGKVTFWLPRPFHAAANDTYDWLRQTVRPYAVLPEWKPGMSVITFQSDGTPRVHQLQKAGRFLGEATAIAAMLRGVLRIPKISRTWNACLLAVAVYGLLELYLRYLQPS